MFHKLFVMEFMMKEKNRELERYAQQQQLLRAAQEDPAYRRPYHQWVLHSLGERLITVGTALTERSRQKSAPLLGIANSPVPCSDSGNTHGTRNY